MEPDEQNLALSQGLLGLGAGLLSGSYGHYGQFAPALGQGMAGFQHNYTNAINSSFQNKLIQAHAAKFNADVDREKRLAAAGLQIGGILGGNGFTPEMPQAPQMPFTPSVGGTALGGGNGVVGGGAGYGATGARAPGASSPMMQPAPSAPIEATATKFEGPESDKFLAAYKIAAQNDLPGAETYYQNYRKARNDEQYKAAFQETFDSIAKKYPATRTDNAGGATVDGGDSPLTKSEFWRSLSSNLRDRDGMGDASKEAMSRALELDKMEQSRASEKRQEGKQTVSNENTLRDDYNKASRTFVDVRDGYQRILESAKSPSAAGDLSLIFSYMKILDPTSVVREGEQASAANARGVPEAVRSWYNRVVSGEKLTDVQRADFVDRGGMLYGAALSNQKSIEDQYTGIAKRSMVNPENVVIPYRVKSLATKYGLE